MTKVINNKKQKNDILYILLFVFASILMGIGYASVNGVLVSIEGEAKAISLDSLHITNVVYVSDVGADLETSSINNYTGTTLNSSITLGSNSISTITYDITIYNTTNDNYIFSGTSYSAPNFYDNLNITYDLNGLNVGDTIYANTNITFSITFRYTGNNTTNPTLNSYISFDFEKYYTITYQNINTTNQNYPTMILDSESTKTITFTNDIPHNVNITPTVSYTYTNGVLTLNNVKTDIVIDRYYSITYVLNGGTNPANQPTEYLHGSTVNILNPTYQSRIFGGWYRNATFTGTALTSTTGLNEDLTLYAKWLTSSYQNAITYLLNLTGGAPSNTTNIITVTSSDSTCTNTFAYDGTANNNLRYVGANPCNYVKFNCDSNNNCELWRIIGIMNGISNQPVIKLIKNDNSASALAWDSGKKNNWNNASLNTYLNGTYKNSLNSGTTNYIQDVQWNIGGVTTASNVQTAYTQESGTKTTSALSIGLFSPSDFAFGTSATDDTSRSTCINNALNSSNVTSTCNDNNYLFVTNDNQWTINKRSNGNNQGLMITNAGLLSNSTTQSSHNYRPIVHLKNDIQLSLTEGNGSSSDPYILHINS